MTLNESGEIDGDFTAGISTLGTKSPKPGPVKFSAQSTGTIGAGGDIDMGAVGGKHNDVATISYSGTNNGEIDVFELGNGGSEDLSADIFMIPGSTGSVGSSNNQSIVEGSGKDQLSFTVEQGNDTTTTSNVFAQIIGKSKKDKVTHTANVIVQTKGKVTLAT